MATGEIRWFSDGDLGFIAVEDIGPIEADPIKGAQVVRTTKEGEFFEVELDIDELAGYDIGQAIEMRPARVASPVREGLSGEWRSFISLANQKGLPKKALDRDHISEAFDFSAFGLSSSHIGLPEPIQEYGVYVLPVHLGKGLIASIYVNLAKSKSEAQKQQTEFFKRGAEVSFRIETRYPYLSGTSLHTEEASPSLNETEFWMIANLHSLSIEAKDLANSMEETAGYVSNLCKSIS